MEEQFWHDRWANNQIAFHGSKANSFLVGNFHAVCAQTNVHVFVPLCGKSQDLHWLAQQGCRVSGAELNQLAVEQFFEEQAVKPLISTLGTVRRYEGKGIVIFQGSIFDLTADILNPVDMVYDRAALVALPRAMRDRYASHLRTLTSAAPQLLICYEYDQNCTGGPPFSVEEDEVRHLYRASFQIELLERRSIQGGFRGKYPASEAVWRLRQR